MIRFSQIVTQVNAAIFHAAKWLVYVMLIFMLIEVVFRYALGRPTGWAPELAVLLFGPYFLLAGAHLLHLGGHVSVDLLSAGAQGRTKRTIHVVGCVMAIIFSIILTWFAIPLAWDSYLTGETSYTIWAPQLWPVKASLPIAAILLCLQAIADIINPPFAANEPEVAR